MPEYRDAKGSLYKNPASGEWEEQQGSNGAKNVQLMGTNVIQPTDIQSHLQQTIQTHNAVTIPLNGGTSDGGNGWIDTDGFDKVGFMAQSGTALNWQIDAQWSNDNVNMRGTETVSPSSATNSRTLLIDTKARYMKFVLKNNDTSTPQTLSAWAYLKA